MAGPASTDPGHTPTLPAPAAELRRQLLVWYDGARRRLPWRAAPRRAADAYAVLVSEVMLQQTTVATARGRFAGFLARFPDLTALAAAPLEDVLHAWQGLGYYRRARALHALAREVAERRGGRLPDEPAALAALPGLGPYSAAAVRAIAFGHPVLPVDGNVARVLARLAGVEAPLPAAMPVLRRLADALAGGARPGDLAQAVMEVGALVCRPRAPACAACPWRDACRARARGEAEALPRRAPRPQRPRRFATAFLAVAADGRLLLRYRPANGLLGGLPELPSTPWTGLTPWADAAALAHAPVAARWRALPGTVRHVFTHLALELSLLRGEANEAGEGTWCRPERLGELALPTLTKKLLRHAGYGVG
jgi:A/G-specific adenine glycosylase